jgi:hypothetical protein
VIYVATGTLEIVAGSLGFLSYYTRYVTYASLLFGVLALLVQIGRRLDDKSIWWKLSTWLIVQFVLLFMVHSVLWTLVPDWSDLQKALFVMVTAPIATEVALTVGRFVSRGLPERHEAASWVLNGCT